MMVGRFGLHRPETLETGRQYVWLRRAPQPGEAELLPVRLVQYAPCPAWVYISMEGRVLCCPRDELFLWRRIGKTLSPVQENSLLNTGLAALIL